MKRYFKVDARAMLTWGRDSIKDHTTAVLELVKNGYDAGASVVEIKFCISPVDPNERYLRISDNGCGMSEKELSRNWLRLGYSEKKLEKLTKGGRRKTGEKGIGRISADRLGAILELRSQSDSHEAVGLRVNWNAFDRVGKLLTRIQIPDIDPPDFLVPQFASWNEKGQSYEAPPSPKQNSPTSTGTELTIRNLRQGWTKPDLEDLRRELSILTPPFGGVKDFQIRLDCDAYVELNGVVTSPFYNRAEIEAEFTCTGGPEISFCFKDRDRTGKSRASETGLISWSQLIHSSPEKTKPKKGLLDNVPTLDEGQKMHKCPSFGPVSVRLLFYPRSDETLRGTKLTLGQLRDFLDSNAGIKVYRDQIRVMPYGDPKKPEGDWLGLGDRKARSPAGPRRSEYRVAPNQLVGAVFLSRDDNPNIVDTSGREGLVHGEQFQELKAFLLGCLLRLEAHYHRIFLKRLEEQPPEPSPREIVRDFDHHLRVLTKELKNAEALLPERAGREIENLRDQIISTSKRIGVLQRSMTALASQATIYRGLATLGIASATFGHETEASLDIFLSSAHTALNLIEKQSPSLIEVIEEIEKSIKYGKRVSEWGAYALRRVRSEKRQIAFTDITELIEDLVEELRPPLEASDIKIYTDFKQVSGETFQMDVESVVINLITNAYYFSKLGDRARKVLIRLSPTRVGADEGFEISVSDSGPGVSDEIKDQIWEPLFSTKVDREGRSAGTGLGLSIVESVIKDIGGSRFVTTDPKLGGAKFVVSLRLN